MNRFAAAAALAVIVVPVPASAAEVSPAAMQAAARYALPRIVASIRTTCASKLANGGFLARNGAELEQRYAKGAEAAWPAARAALIEFGDQAQPGIATMIGQMPDSALKPFVDATLSSMIAARVKPAQCPDIERGMELVAPLPPENVAGLVGFLFELKERDDTVKARPRG